MHRFRKRSDAKRQQVSLEVHLAQIREQHDGRLSPGALPQLPQLPPESDFRTSLILPDLSRRFTLLRESIDAEELRSRFAEQRARNAEFQVSPEEEDMILETLGRIRSPKRKTNQGSNDHDMSTSMSMSDDGRFSQFSGFTPSITSTPQKVPSSSTLGSEFSNNAEQGSALSNGTHSSPSTPRSVKRYSNNFFGSNKFKDYSYIRETQRARLNSQDSSTSARRPNRTGQTLTVTRDEDPFLAGPRSAPPYTSTQYDQPTKATLRLGKRASIALQAVIKEIEEEGGLEDEDLTSNGREGDRGDEEDHGYEMEVHIRDELDGHVVLGEEAMGNAEASSRQAASEAEDGDEIVIMPRVKMNPSQEQSPASSDTEEDRRMSVPIPMAILPDVGDTNDHSTESIAIADVPPQAQHPTTARASPIPSQVTPGYIPGMPRPMTPRDDFDERSHSTTPRATSPSHAHTHSSSFSMTSPTSSFAAGGQSAFNMSSSFNGSSSLATSLLRREMSSRGSNTSRSGSPMFQRGNEGQENGTQHSASPSYSSTYSTTSWRRPASPLSAQAFQPFSTAVSAPDLSRTPRPSDEPSPPRQSTNSSRPGTPSSFSHNAKNVWAHHRDASWTTSEEAHAQQNGSAGDHNPSASTRSLRSPALPDSPLIEAIHSLHAVTQSMGSASGPLDSRPMSPMSLGGGAPAHSPSASLAFDSPSKRSSRQNHPNNPYANGFFSPIAGSSRSSLESSGSSYHSSECDGRDRVWEVFGDADEAREPKWHDLPPPTGADSENDEAVIKRTAGLTKSDLAKIQEKLVDASIVRQASVPDHRERAASLRRRRPSTSQSNYSYKDITRAAASSSPPQSPTIAAQRPSDDGPDYEANARANALLNSVVDSIRTTGPMSPPPSSPPPAPPATPAAPAMPSNAPRKEAPPSLTIPSIGNSRDVSPATRRNRDLAQLIFGEGEGPAEQDTSQQITIPPQPQQSETSPVAETPATFPMLSPKEHPPTTPLTAGGPYRLRNPSTPRIPRTPEEEAELTREVQRRADAATAALRKSPSATNLNENVQNAPPAGQASRKRISPHQISTPKLVSASTSVDAIALQPAGNQGSTSKFGSRLKRLRGTLRGKTHAVPTGEEVTPFTLGAPSVPSPTPPPPTFRVDPSPPQSQVHTPSESTHEIPTGATGLSKSSSGRGSGFKGLFMSRLRSKSRAGELTPELERKEPQQATGGHTATASMSAMSALYFGDNRERENTYSQPMLSAPLLSRPYAAEQENGPPSSNEPSSSEPDQDGRGSDAQALRQLFDAASNLGLDPDALGELLKRSGSTSTKAPSKWGSMSRSNSVSTTAYESRPSTTIESRSIPEIARDSPLPEEPPSMSSMPEPSMRRSASRKRGQPRPSGEERKSVVRRTIFFPSNTRMSNFDPMSLLKAPTPKGRKRASTSSVLSTRSVQDRAPTPPPARASMGGRHNSVDVPPPVPTIPSSLSSPAQDSFILPVPPPRPSMSADNSNSEGYDSFYDMYSSEQQRRGPSLDSATGPAVEVVEFADGEMIWNIVDGLRDDDRDSTYNVRASFASEYSVGGDSMQVTFKDRSQGGKRLSLRNSTFGSSLKPPSAPAGSASRPETKVFYSSTAQIGRLIEQLANSGSEAGAFNFRQNPNSQSQSSSFVSSTDSNWTVEDRLEHMISSMRPV
ncbi:uncharacterized protein SCHCODRAFT_02606387 [Schizophyllum commune H4-8]|uniref:uncharacterized protein n=1 Tax=Schizophyllum commune (strain H4-8 / FGSC 9210) TaxID=578458 RepID=UPI00215FC72A|nr:uncharacterized protein SCHCODRAFT_02606387 [Schizophyllum commune H4-8]KAI5899878.1 hypothetical protein SCHCODRAFT_02606387 [Schizophyllum commune H4-8]